MNRLFLGVLIVTVLLAPAPILAAALTEAQIQAVVSLVRSFNTDVSVVAAVEASLRKVSTPSPTPTPSYRGDHPICKRLLLEDVAIVPGGRGDSVREVQEFLAAEGKFKAEATGYFGPLTADALGRWQVENGVVTKSDPSMGWGTLGPRTKERIKLWCGGEAQARFSASPQRGVAPLPVTFSAWVGGFTPYQYAIDFGDGSARENIACNAPADACIEPGKVTHVYQKDGSYSAVLYKTVTATTNATAVAKPGEAIGKVAVYVGSESVCTKEYKPMCGQPPEPACRKTPPYCMLPTPGPTTYGNECMLKSAGATFLYEGVCKDDTTGNKPPVISGLSGPTTLGVSQTGTWVIKAHDPENQTLSYQVKWGDENLSPTSSNTAARLDVAFTQSTTFTHAYSQAGTYTVVVVVKDSSGSTAKTTTTVKVGSDTVFCTADAMLCPDGTYVGRTGPNCQFVCPSTTQTQ